MRSHVYMALVSPKKLIFLFKNSLLLLLPGADHCKKNRFLGHMYYVRDFSFIVLYVNAAMGRGDQDTILANIFCQLLTPSPLQTIICNWHTPPPRPPKFTFARISCLYFELEKCGNKLNCLNWQTAAYVGIGKTMTPPPRRRLKFMCLYFLCTYR